MLNIMATKIKIFTFNPFQENTYVISNDLDECIIIDPGCSNVEEEEELNSHIVENGLRPIACWLTHAHIDHVQGCTYVKNMYGLLPQMSQGEKINHNSNPMIANMYGLRDYEHCIASEDILPDNGTLKVGGFQFETLFTPGHSPASICFYNAVEGYIIAGDVLFRDSIGRTDLPGGDFATLESSIKNKLYKLPEETKVFPGHGPQTIIRYEKKNNPFVKE